MYSFILSLLKEEVHLYEIVMLLSVSWSVCVCWGMGSNGSVKDRAGKEASALATVP